MFDMNLDQLKKLDGNAPDTMRAFWAFDKEVFKAVLSTSRSSKSQKQLEQLLFGGFSEWTQQ